MRHIIHIFLATLLMFSVGMVRADLVVVVNPKTGVEKLSREEVVNIFLGRFRQIGSGLSALPVDLPSAQPEKAAFYMKLVNKELAEINAYWARLVFSGRTQPPRQAVSDDDMLKYVAFTPGAIGYIERSKVDGRVRIVFDLGQ